MWTLAGASSLDHATCQNVGSTMVLDDVEYDDDCLHCCRRVVLSPCQCFAWVADVTSGSVRCLAFPVSTELAVGWALEVERFAAVQAAQLIPE